MATTQEKAQCVSWFIETKSEPSMEEIHRYVRQFAHSTRNLWTRGQSWIKGGVDDQEQRDGPIPTRSLPWTSFYGVKLKILCIEQRYGTSLI